ncbi:fatty acyl-CoA reductase wat [Zeugodacus cucurbitae]|uniref:fatty acyl-CoA reductase wat n=1 Tax=Zeugodacus cucurbitae TaxID=28588 RepID=UPI0023D961C9|nr:fatty acyl-CoA reductase wat [Zeugodacus cucurbitae]
MSSDIQNFYRNKTVFVTGGTGFMGLVLIEKLLRSTEVKRVYILVRPKKGKSIEERLTDFCQCVIFEGLRNTGAKLTDRIQPILGDCQYDNLGISAEDRQVLITEVNVVIHLAATVRFDEPLHKAVRLNVRATLDLLELAKEMQNLESFVHVSSAYANCVVQSIDEKYYNRKLGISAVKMCEVANSLGPETTNKLSTVLCAAYDNTYTFTKSLAEDAVLNEGRALPISIFRPAIVIQTYKEPLTGWVGNYYGPSAALYACARGVLRVMQMQSEHRAHLVPADLCASLMLAIGWETARSDQRQRLNLAPPIYNYANDDENPLYWRQYMSTIVGRGPELPLAKMIWFPFMITVSKKWVYDILTFFYHIIPGAIIDVLLTLKGKRRRMIRLYRGIHKLTKATEFFIVNEFQFTMDNTKALWDSLSARDKDIFNFDLRSINWKEYIKFSLSGMRLYLGGEGPETIPRGKIMFKRFLFLHRLTQLLVITLFVSLIWCVASKFFL